MLRCLLGILVYMALASSVEAKTVIGFSGRLNLDEQTLTLEIPGESQSIHVSLTKHEDGAHVNVDIDHWQTPFGNIATELQTQLDVVRDGQGQIQMLQGRIDSQYTIFDYHPIKDLSGKVQLAEGILTIDHLTFGRLDLNGSVDLIAPYELSLTLKLHRLPMEDFIRFWSTPQVSDVYRGDVTGEIVLSGTKDQLNMRGALATYAGQIRKLKYDSLMVQFEGSYPVIKLVQSSVTKNDGLSFHLEGKLDLARRKEFVTQIKALSILPIVERDDTKTHWVFKRFGTNNSESDAEIQYFIRKERGFENMNEEAGSMLGMERRIGF